MYIINFVNNQKFSQDRKFDPKIWLSGIKQFKIEYKTASNVNIKLLSY